jgi:hypothetical protein
MKTPPLTIKQILAWADEHHRRTGCWPTRASGRVHGTKDETWYNIACCLYSGHRGLPRGPSLHQLLVKHRGKSAELRRPALTVEQILAWADAHHKRTGRWPTNWSGRIPETKNDTWQKVGCSLYYGCRGMPGGSSIHRLLLKHRGLSARSPRPALTIAQILAWADAHYQRTGRWPTYRSGPVHGAPGETWYTVNTALRYGKQGLPGGPTLRELLIEARQARFEGLRPFLKPPQILVWADAHHRRTGRWPTVNSGSVFEAPSETWMGIDHALRGGGRGLPAGSSLFRLLAKERGVPRNR